MEIGTQIEFNENHDHAGSQGIVLGTHPQNGTYQIRIMKGYHAAGCIVSANSEQTNVISNPISNMKSHYTEPMYDEISYEEPEKTYLGISKKRIYMIIVAIILAMIIAYAIENYGGKHNASMAKVKTINAKNLELVNERDSMRTKRDNAQKQLEFANAEIKTIEEDIRKNKADISALLETIYK